jgi:hypothetical protein
MEKRALISSPKYSAMFRAAANFFSFEKKVIKELPYE